MSKKKDDEFKESQERALESVVVTSVPAEHKDTYIAIGDNICELLRAENKIIMPNAMVAMTVLEQGIKCVLEYLGEHRSKDEKFEIPIKSLLTFGIESRNSDDEEKEGNYYAFVTMGDEGKIISKSDESTED